jgi:hypothetical protein
LRWVQADEHKTADPAEQEQHDNDQKRNAHGCVWVRSVASCRGGTAHRGRGCRAMVPSSRDARML